MPVDANMWAAAAVTFLAAFLLGWTVRREIELWRRAHRRDLPMVDLSRKRVGL